MALSNLTLHIKDMHCHSCQEKLQHAIGTIAGVSNVRADLNRHSLWVEFDAAVCTPIAIKNAVGKAGYNVGQTGSNKFLGMALIFAAILLLGEHSAGIDMDAMLSPQTSYFMLFLIGALTSLHCAGMCGGIMVSQTIAKELPGGYQPLQPAVLYNAGRLLSYTAIGALVGALGSVIAVSLSLKAGVTIFAGSFMILMGLNLIGFRLALPLPHKLRLLCARKVKAQGPFTVGLLNGLLPCGPLQTMQVYALGTGSAVAGATAMFIFGLGTIPLMLPLGLVTGWLNKNHAGRILKFSGVLVIVLGVIMANRGLAIAGVYLPWTGALGSQTALQATAAKAEIMDGVQVVRIAANNNGYVPNIIIVQKNIPVKWIIDGQQINSCNNEIIVPSLHIQKKLRQGENIIEFIPEAEDIRFSCWMGMIEGLIKVVDNLNSVDAADIEPLPSPAGCCGGDCCSVGTAAPPSIYGNDLAQEPTERLIRKAVLQHDLQTAVIKGIGADFEPLVVIAAQNKTAKLVFNLKEFADAEGKYEVIDITNRNRLAGFIGRQGVVNVQLKLQQTGSYGILKQGRLLGIIEVVADLDATDPERVREKLF